MYLTQQNFKNDAKLLLCLWVVGVHHKSVGTLRPCILQSHCKLSVLRCGTFLMHYSLRGKIIFREIKPPAIRPPPIPLKFGQYSRRGQDVKADGIAKYPTLFCLFEFIQFKDHVLFDLKFTQECTHCFPYVWKGLSLLRVRR